MSHGPAELEVQLHQNTPSNATPLTGGRPPNLRLSFAGHHQSFAGNLRKSFGGSGVKQSFAGHRKSFGGGSGHQQSFAGSFTGGREATPSAMDLLQSAQGLGEGGDNGADAECEPALTTPAQWAAHRLSSPMHWFLLATLLVCGWTARRAIVTACAIDASYRAYLHVCL